MVGQFVLMMKNKAIYLQVKKMFSDKWGGSWTKKMKERKNQMNCKVESIRFDNLLQTIVQTFTED